MFLLQSFIAMKCVRRPNCRKLILIFLLLVVFGSLLLFSYFSKSRSKVKHYVSKHLHKSFALKERLLNLPVSPLRQIPRVKAQQINCKAVFQGNKAELREAKKYMQKHPKVKVSPEELTRESQNCTAFRLKRMYIMSTLTREEAEFPIAFSLLIYKDPEQAERLLRTIYRPQNFYCIHVDKKSPAKIHQAMQSVAGCFDNVFIPTKKVDVQWGFYSVLEPDIICMRELLKYKKWKYFINLTGQEFPLKTNYELVKILTAYNGANDLEGTVKRSNPERYSDIGSPPHGIVPVKGAIHIIASRGFSEYAIYNPIAQDFLNWCKKAKHPDEVFFNSLNHNPSLKVPGSYKGDPETHPEKKPFLARFKNWGSWPFFYTCHGIWVRGICIFGIADLPLLSTRRELFLNKFHLDFEYLGFDCMEEWLFNKTLRPVELNMDYYRNLSFVHNKF